MLKPFLFLCFISLSIKSLAQKEANVWVLNDDVGIDFNYNRFTPFVGNGQINQFGSTAVMCEKKSGKLLFYTNGRIVWNRNFEIMPRGSGLRGGYSTTQAALIVPMPGNESKFYLFTTKSYSDTTTSYIKLGDTEFTGCYYSIVDMQLNAGLGDIIESTKNTLLLEKSTDKLTAIPHANGRDYWIITHEWGSSRFVVFILTNEGLGEPRFIDIGNPYFHYESQGWLKASPNGKMLTSALQSGASDLYKPLELYDFDDQLGTISNYRSLGNYGRLFGVSFSPDNSKLYFTYFDQNDPSTTFGGLFQMDMNAGDVNDIIKSTTELYFVQETGLGRNDTLTGSSLQIGPDGRLYPGTFGLQLEKKNDYYYEQYLIFYIDKPDLPGWECAPSYRKFNLTRNTLTSGIYHNELPNLMQHYFNNLKPQNNFFDEEECAKSAIHVYPNPTSGLIILDDITANCSFPLNALLYNTLGQKINTFEITAATTSALDISKYSPGLYLLYLKTPFKTDIIRIVKQ